MHSPQANGDDALARIEAGLLPYPNFSQNFLLIFSYTDSEHTGFIMDGFETKIYLLVGVQYDEGCGQFDRALVAVSNSRAATIMAAQISVHGWNTTQNAPATGSDSPRDAILQYNLPNFWVEIQEIPLYEKNTYSRPETNRRDAASEKI